MGGARFCGHKTGFNPTGENVCDPNELGPPATKFGGRPAVPAGPLKFYPGSTADISTGNRRLSKSHHGDGGGHGTRFCGTTAFGDYAPGTDTGRVPGGMGGSRKRSASYNKK